MSFSTILFTEKGRALQAKALAGATLTFTKLAMGSGSLGGQSQITLPGLIDLKVNLSITAITHNTNYVTIKGNFSNADINTGFYWREIGVYAQDPDLGEILYCYGNAGSLAEYIPSVNSEIVEKVVGISVIVGDTINVTATINDAMIFATKEEIIDINNEINTLKAEGTLTEVILSQHKSIFTSGTGKDSLNVDQDYSDKALGQSNVKIEGSTVVNLIRDGDFPSLTNWAYASVGTPVVVNNEVMFTATEVNGGIIQSFRVVPNHKLYVCAIVLGSADLVITDNVTMSYSVSHSANTGIYEKLVIYQQLASNNLVAEQLFVKSNVSSGWAPIKVRDVMTIDLTALFGAGNEPTKEQCDFMYDHYINGLQGVGSGKIVSRGSKNLFNKLDTTQGTYKNVIGADVANSALTGTDYIRVKANTPYYHNRSGHFTYWDANKQFISGDTGGYSFTTPQNCVYLTSVVETANIDSFQIEEGSVATPYEPYQSSELVTTMPTGMQIHRLPNGIYDTIEEVNAIRTLFKKTKEYALVASDISELRTEAVNIDAVLIKKPTDYAGYNNTTIGTIAMMLQGFVAGGYADSLNNIGNLYNSTTTHVGVIIPKGTYATLAAAQTALAGTKVVYELATPLIYANGINGFYQEGNLEVYEDGVIYQESSVNSKEYNNAKLGITYNLSDKALIMANSEEITAISKQIIGRLKNADLCVESGNLSNAEGAGTQATGAGASATGAGSIASGLYSRAEGYITKAIGNSSHAEGASNWANGDYSHAEGQNTIANGNYSHAEGKDTRTDNWYAHAEGFNTIASGVTAHGEGDSTLAAGASSHAEGQSTKANALRSHAGGLGTIADGNEQFVGGRYNSPNGSDLFQIGNGSSDANRSNAMRVTADGSLILSGGITPNDTLGVLTSTKGTIVGGYIKRGREVVFSLKLTLTASIAINDVIVSGFPKIASDYSAFRGCAPFLGTYFDAIIYSENGSLISGGAYNSGQILYISGSFISL
jgi:hypothetical protein